MGGEVHAGIVTEGVGWERGVSVGGVGDYNPGVVGSEVAADWSRGR
jgi:hypothetical protein